MLLQPCGLAVPQGRARFHQHQPQAVPKLWPCLGQQYTPVSAQLAVAGAPFHDVQWPVGVGGKGIKAFEQLRQQPAGKVLPETGCRNEITMWTKGDLPFAVVAVPGVLQHPGHVGGEGNRTTCCLKLFLQPRRTLSG